MDFQEDIRDNALIICHTNVLRSVHCRGLQGMQRPRRVRDCLSDFVIAIREQQYAYCTSSMDTVII